MSIRTRAISRVTTLFHSRLTPSASLSTCIPPMHDNGHHTAAAYLDSRIFRTPACFPMYQSADPLQVLICPFCAKLRDVFKSSFCVHLSSTGHFLYVLLVSTCSLPRFPPVYKQKRDLSTFFLSGDAIRCCMCYCSEPRSLPQVYPLVLPPSRTVMNYVCRYRT